MLNVLYASVTNKPFMLSVIALNVVMLNVVAPFSEYQPWGLSFFTLALIRPTVMQELKVEEAEKWENSKFLLPCWDQQQNERTGFFTRSFPDWERSEGDEEEEGGTREQRVKGRQKGGKRQRDRENDRRGEKEGREESRGEKEGIGERRVKGRQRE
jgi:hypothetical protein